jgi:hypothetical protein
MIMGKVQLIPIVALVIMLIGAGSSAYVYATQIDKDTITLNGEEYTIDQIFYITKSKAIQTVDGEKTGVAVDDLIQKAGVGCPSCYEYTIKASDGYEKTVSWEIMKTGVLSYVKKVFFPDTPKAFWIGDIIEIEVK